MKTKAVASVVVALTLLTGGPAFAQEGRDRHDDERHEQDHRDGHQDRRDGGGQQHDERGAGPNHEFHRGDRLPPENHNRQYVVDDWRGHHLSAPPRGYHWVQTGGDYVLVAITTGVILQMLLNN